MAKNSKLKLEALHHVALYVRAPVFERSVHFYKDLLGMSVIWQPDEDNVYLSSGVDNLALHRISRWSLRALLGKWSLQYLDHIGFRLSSADDVDAWHSMLKEQGVPIAAPPKTHRDKTRSFYCLDPNGTTVQLIHHPEASST